MGLVTITCATCGKPYQTYAVPSKPFPKYCDDPKCNAAGRSGRGKRNPDSVVTIACEVCQTSITVRRRPDRPIPRTCCRAHADELRRREAEARALDQASKLAAVEEAPKPKRRPTNKREDKPAKRVYANQVMYAREREHEAVRQQVSSTGWRQNGHPLCANGAHWSEEVERQGALSLFRCRRCGAERWLSNAGPMQDTWNTRRGSAGAVAFIETTL